MNDRLPTYPRNLGWASPDALIALGLRENVKGQLIDQAGRLVCELSGRSHDGGGKRPYLIGPLPHYLPLEDRWIAVWIDQQAAIEAGLAAARRGGGLIARFLLDKLSRVFA